MTLDLQRTGNYYSCTLFKQFVIAINADAHYSFTDPRFITHILSQLGIGLNDLKSSSHQFCNIIVLVWEET